MNNTTTDTATGVHLPKFTGVSIVKSVQIRARIEINGVKIILGSFKTEQKAHEFYLMAKKHYHLFEGDKKEFIKKIKELI
jgi:hypothetical protein